MGTGRVGIILKAPLEVGEPGSRPMSGCSEPTILPGWATQATQEKVLSFYTLSTAPRDGSLR